MVISITVFSVIILLFTVFSLIRADYWTFRVFDYPRLQKFVLSVIALSLLLYYNEQELLWYDVLMILMSLNLFYLGWLIWPFTVLSKKQVLTAKIHQPEDRIGLMISNVYQENQDYKGCLKVIKDAAPDVVLLLETNQRWEEETQKLDENYPYQVKIPLENTYGMLLFSKLELRDSEVHYLVEKDIPSIHTRVVLASGREVQLFAVHPTPPVPNENPRATERDKELLIVADLAKASDVPVIVMGDLNDVAWSYTTNLFLKMSGLLDPRRGRGFYNSFHAGYFFLRFPLDHAFISPDFKFVSMQRLDNYHSDHFPICLHLQFEEQASLQQEPMEVDEDDMEEAEEKKEKE